jgi:hypothetical protein
MPAAGPGPAAATAPIEPDIEYMADRMTREHPSVKRIQATYAKHLARGARDGHKQASKLKVRRGHAGGMRRARAT